MKKLNKKAFTIVELLIASMVFTAVLMLCMEGITRIAKAYTKNASISKSSEFIKSLTEEITQQVKYGSSVPSVSNTEGANITRICVGGNAYRVVLNSKSTDAVKKKQDTNCSSYAVTSPDFFQGADNLAPSGMRVLNFGISSADNKVWQVDMRIALGDNDLLEDSSGVPLTNPSANFKTAKCRSGAGGEYCAAMSLSTTVIRRMAN
jgi:type II secretory pathway pseudopilin PulG